MAASLRRDGRPGDAARTLRALLEQHPRAWPLWHDLGLALAADGRPDEAAISHRRALGLGGARLGACWVNLGNALRAAGHKRMAVDAYLTAIEAEPNLAPAFYNLHAALYDDRSPRAAEAALARAHALRPQHADSAFYLAALRRVHGLDEKGLLASLPAACTFLVESLGFVEAQRDRRTRLFADTFDTLAFALGRAPSEGRVVELGVRHGTSLRFLAANCRSDRVHGFDSFAGLPSAWGDQAAGLYSTDGALPPRPDNVALHPGWFSDTLPAFLASTRGVLRFVHVDCDLHSSTAEALELLAPRIVAGTVLVFDEYLANPGWQNEEHRALCEAADRHRWRFGYLAFSLFTKQAVVRVTSVG